jgi:hypothetical protein
MSPRWPFLLTLITLLVSSLTWAVDNDGFEDTFNVRATDLATTGRNDYLILEPGRQLILESTDKKRLTVSVTTEIKKIDNVDTRIVEERQSQAGKSAQITRLYLALDKTTTDIYCFGKDVDQYTSGKVTSHPSAWLAGKNNARPGLYLPGKPAAAQKAYQELAPNNSRNRFEVLGTTDDATVPAGKFHNCLRIKVSSPLTSAAPYFKIYAPGIGLVTDGPYKLIKQGQASTKPAAQGNGQTPIIPHELARDALSAVGADPQAEAIWVNAINDPALSPHQRSDLIEDLNETGFADPKNVTPEELPIVLNRLELIDRLQPDAMDETNAAAFEEAYEDLSKIADRLTTK